MNPYYLLEMPLDLTARLRQAVREKLNPQTGSDVRQIWDLWYMKEQYCYLITNAHKIFTPALLAEFQQARNERVSQIDLKGSNACLDQVHVYVNGMFQGIHNDSTKAGYSYVYYLQDEIHFTGGQTFLYTKPFPDSTKPAASTAFYERIDPVCGRMVLFNNNIPHQVAQVQGTMDPSAGRMTICSRYVAP